MKTCLLTAICIIVLGSIATAQLPGQVQTAADTTADITYQSVNSVSATQPIDEFTPLSNVPLFPGGHKALEKYVRDLALYPQQARKEGIEGTVHVQFRVLSTGYLIGFEVVRSGGQLLDAAALKAVAMMPRWYPAHRSGVAVSSLYILPVTFNLGSSN